MRNSFIKIFILLAIGFSCPSCDDKLDVEPNDTVDAVKALETSADVESLLVGAYNALGDGDVLGGNMQRDAELIGDGGEIFWDGTFVAPGEIFSKKMLITNDQARQTWLDAYSTINICNSVLENIDLVTEDRKERVEGEAKFVRGLVYFELVRLYARAWTDGDPSENPGLPLVTKSTTVDNATDLLERNSVSEVYAQVLSDLTQAGDLLPEVNGFFATKYSAYAILSRVYLMQNDYGNAGDYADKVISSGMFSLTSNPADAFNKTSTSAADRTSNGNATPEDVFAIQVTAQDGVNNLNTFFASADFGGRGDILIESAHFAMYDHDDKRALLFYDDTYTSKWNNIAGNVNIVRLAEIYLTRAEAGKRTDDWSPLEDINIIRARAGLLPATSVTIEDILLQRRLELAFEGHLIHDLKRTKQNAGAMEFDNPFLIFPIPQRETIINPGLRQNDAYLN
jgi:starch-binding outer membrane protein, SusD/RagB family